MSTAPVALPGLDRVFDAPRAATVSAQLTEGSGLGALVEPPVTHASQESHANTGGRQSAAPRQPLAYTLVGEGTQRPRTMVLHLAQSEQLGERLKHQLTYMLEFAEEELQCDRVLLGVSRKRQDKDALLKTLLFLGFAGYQPRDEDVPPDISAGDYAYMVYQICD